jgi:hypothetical protein
MGMRSDRASIIPSNLDNSFINDGFYPNDAFATGRRIHVKVNASPLGHDRFAHGGERRRHRQLPQAAC